MNLKNFIAGIEIIKQYYNNQEGYYLRSEYEQFFLYETDRPITPEHVEMLKELDWFQPYADEDDEGESEYDPNIGWSAFI